MDAETLKKEMVIEIPADVVEREAQSVTAQYARVARVPGFRPGHAPPSLVWRLFRKDIRSEVVQSLLPRFFEDAIKEQKLALAGRPEFNDLKFEDNQPISCKATFEIFPEFELKEYKGLEAEEDDPTVTEADVDEALEELRQRVATFEVVEDRPAEKSDYLIVNYQGRDANDPAASPVEARDALVHLGGKGTVGAFTENLDRTRPGDVREFEVAYPEDYPQKSLAGKSLHYRVEVQSIKKKVVPALDDELAKSVSEFSKLEELRVKLREDLKERRRRAVGGAAKQKLVEQLLQAHPIPVPKVVVEKQLNRRLERVLMQLMAQGIDPRATEVDWSKVREESRPEAEKEVRASLILGKIAEAEGIQVSEDEVDELVREMSKEGQETPAALKTRLTRDGELDRIVAIRRNQKALDFIYSNARIIRKNGPDPARVEG